MKIIRRRLEMTDLALDARREGKSIGFVPTMGFLHEGHLSLVERARAENDVVAVSIFVNPTQFGPDEDFESYPRDPERDAAMLEGVTDYLFLPDAGEMYGADEKMAFQVMDLTQCLCGISRPHHFSGVMLVVAKLLNIIRPHKAYFGQKDYQQTVVVRRLIEDLFFGTELVVCPTVREADGLAKSSRNTYLSPEERAQAVVLRQSLCRALDLIQMGERSAEVIIQKMKQFITSKNLARIDYADVRDAENLRKVEAIDARKVVIALAVYFGTTRLIDNLVYDPDHAS